MLKRKKNFWAFFIVIIAVLITSLLPLIFNHHYYYIDDTQNGAIGQWFELGKNLIRGHIPVLNVAAQSAGNYVMEGQWGGFNPLTWGIAVLVYLCPSFLISATIIKVFFLVLLGTGSYLLLKSFNVGTRCAMVGGVVIPTIGFTSYVDATSWVTGLIVFALLPWFWWSFNIRMQRNSLFILITFIFGYSIIATGYVYGTIYLVMILFGDFIYEVCVKNWTNVLKNFSISLPLALVTLAIYLPGIITSSYGVTSRNQGVYNFDFLSPTVGSLFSSFLSNTPGWIDTWSGPLWNNPILFITWLLPLVIFVKPNSVGMNKLINQFGGSYIAILIMSFFLTFGPDEIGPLRFPVRNFSYLAFVIIIFLMFTLSNSTFVVNSKRILILVIVVAIGIYLSWSQVPSGGYTYVFNGLFILVITIAIADILSKQRHNSWAILTVIFITQLTIVAYQHYYMPNSQLPDYTTLKTLKEVKATSSKLGQNPGNVFVAGRMNPKTDWNQTLFSNIWYVGRIKTSAVYSPIGYQKYDKDLKKVTAQGQYDVSAVDKLFSIDKSTGKPLVNLLQIDTIQIVKNGSEDARKKFSALTLKAPPEGWRVVRNTRNIVEWQRAQVKNNVGSVSWHSKNISISQVRQTSRDVYIKVKSVNGNKGKIVLSRVAWPGYKLIDSSSKTKISKPLRGYLLTLQVNKSKSGKVIHLKYTPPFYNEGLLLIALSTIMILLLFTYMLVKKMKNDV